MAEGKAYSGAVNSALYFTAAVLPQAFQLIFLPIVLRLLPPEEFGIIGIGGAGMVGFMAVFTLGMSQVLYMLYFRTADKSRLIWQILYIYSGLIVLVGIVFLLLSKDIGQTMNTSSLVWAWVFASAVSEVLLELARSVIRLKRNALQYFILMVLRGALSNLLFLFILYLGYRNGFYKFVSIASVSGILFIVWTLRSGIFSAPVKPDRRLIRLIFMLGIPLTPTLLSELIFSVFSRIILAQNVQISDVGIYELAMQLTTPLMFLMAAMLETARPSILERVADKAPVNQITAVHVQYILFVALCGFGFLSIFSSELIHLFGGLVYAPAAQLVPLLALSRTILGVAIFFDILHIARKRSRFLGLVAILKTILGIGMLVVLTRTNGGYGAAIALVLTAAFHLLVSWWWWRDEAALKLTSLIPVSGIVGLFMISGTELGLVWRALSYGAIVVFVGMSSLPLRQLAAFPIIRRFLPR